jgi:hypothetical protein
VVFIGGIGVLLEVYLGNINEIYYFFISKFFHFPLVIWPFFVKYPTEIFIPISKNENLQKKIHGIFPIFPFPSSGMEIFFFKIQKIKILNSNFKNDFFQFFSFQIFLRHKRIFPRPEVAKFIKRLQKLPIYP